MVRGVGEETARHPCFDDEREESHYHHHHHHENGGRDSVDCYEQRSDVEACDRDQCCGEDREAIANESERDESECQFRMLRLEGEDERTTQREGEDEQEEDDEILRLLAVFEELLRIHEEEEMMQLEWEETLRQNEEERVLVVLDELLQIHDEEYPNLLEEEQARAQEQDTATVSWEFEDDDDDDLDRLLEQRPLANDSQIEQLVATCDRRDQEQAEGRSTACGCTESDPRDSDNDNNNNNPARKLREATCVVCLEAPRTHAYVPCGHFCVCVSCAKQQRQLQRSPVHSSCPVCQQPVTKVMRIYIP
jgi:hypothetical protein